MNINLFFTTNVWLSIETSLEKCISIEMILVSHSVQLGVYMIEFLFRDEDGAVSVDWVTLTSAVVLLAVVVVYALMKDSAGYLLDEFEVLNARYEADAESVSALGSPLDTQTKTSE